MSDLNGPTPSRPGGITGVARRRWRLLGAILGVVACASGMVWGAGAWWSRAELDRARRDLSLGRPADALPRLARLAARWPAGGETQYLLGLCEKAGGRPEAAAAAWARVPDGSPFAAQAAVLRAQMDIERGRLADAERTLLDALRHPRPEAVGLRHLLAEVLWHQGRYDDITPLLEANWEILGRSDWPRPGDAVDLLRTHVTMDLFPLPVARIKAALDLSESRAPDDDRVWLGRANLALRTGKPDEAKRRLDLCLRLRPDDPAVWLAVLDWAQATGNIEEAWKALAHIPADRVPPGRVAALQSWFAAENSDADAERRALERLTAIDPGNTAALERLVQSALRDGHAARAAELRRGKAETDRALRRYRNLVENGRLADGAREMARLAEALGRRFEARGFHTLVLRRNPGDREARSALRRLGSGGPPATTPGQNLGALVAAGVTRPLGTARAATVLAGPLPEFTDDAAPAGLAFVFENGESAIHQLPETASGGVGLLDFDGDGRLDIFLVQGGPFPSGRSPAQDGDRLFRNRGDGTFEDVSEAAGLAGIAHGYGHGVAVGDVDNDGHPDLFVTRWRAYALYRNRGDGTFEDATGRAGLGGDRDWPTSAAFADLDNDGDLDLYVCHYGVWDAEHPRLCPGPDGKKYISCAPHVVPPLPDHVFRNDGGRFTEVTREAGFTDPAGRGLGVVAADLDDDGKIDLYVANDGTANYLFRNLGGFRFEEVGHSSGVASSAAGGYQAGMGVARGDLDGDGRIDLAVTNFYGESATYFRNLGGGQFADCSGPVGLAAASRYLLGFGMAFLDADDDGRLDLLTANGHVSDARPQVPYTMPLQLLLGGPGGRLADVSERSGPPFQVPHLGRGLAAGDLADDGRVDAVIVVQNEPLIYLHNRTRGGRHLTLRLEGTASNRDAVGARVTVVAGGRPRVSERVGGGSYQSAGDPRLHFGLGDVDRVERIEVHWPSGRIDSHTGLAADATYHLREGDAKARPQTRRDRH